jgi:hypothetical protein
MSAVDSFAGPRVELARYLTSDGERVIYAVRVGGMVVVSDWAAHGAGRAFVIERGVTCERELYALVTDYIGRCYGRRGKDGRIWRGVCYHGCYRGTVSNTARLVVVEATWGAALSLTRSRSDAAAERSVPRGATHAEHSLVRRFSARRGPSGEWLNGAVLQRFPASRRGRCAVIRDRLRACLGTGCSTSAVWGRPVAPARRRCDSALPRRASRSRQPLVAQAARGFDSLPSATQTRTQRPAGAARRRGELRWMPRTRKSVHPVRRSAAGLARWRVPLMAFRTV